MEKIPERDQQESEVSLRPWSSLLIRDFALIWSASLIATTASQMRQVANLYQVYELSGSSLKLGLAGFFQALPFIFFGLFGGLVADVVERKKLIAVTQALNLIPGLALAFLTATNTIHVWHIYLLTFMHSLVQVFGRPARMAIIADLVPRSYLMNAVTLNITTQQASSLIGPVAAGVLIDRLGLGFTYFFDAALHVPAIAAILAMRSSGKPEGQPQRVNLRNLVEGIRFVWTERIILSLLLLDFGVTLVGFYQPILPVFASSVFGVGATGLGILYGAPAVGAIVGSAVLLMVGDVKRKGALAVVAALFFAVSLGLLGLSRSLWMAVLAVGALGLTDAISVSVRRTLVQLLATDDMRGRALSMITVFAQSTNALGALLAGTMAALMGAPAAVLAGTALCIAIIFSITRAIPQLWQYRSK